MKKSIPHKVLVVETPIYFCPLLDDTINETDCYSVNMVRSGLMRPDILNLVIDICEANAVCDKCEHGI